MIGGENSTFGKYALIKRLAMGGMGEVFLAKLRGPSGFKKLLVVKRILQHHSENQDFVEMFLQEARLTAELSHSNIVQIYEMGEIEGCFYIAMEYVHGKSVRDIIDRARRLGENIPAGHVISIMRQLCAGLAYAHNARDMIGGSLGIIHRDVNPQNLLVSYNGELKLIDFGIAKSDLSSSRTESGTIKGKFVYMSPEQSAAKVLDRRSDLFSVGICLYEALTLTNPFVKTNAVLSMDAIQRFDPPPLSSVNRKLAPLDPIIARVLAKDPKERYADCGELGEALQDLMRSGAIDRPPQTLAQYLQDIFEDTIAAEKRMLAAAFENNDSPGPAPSVPAVTTPSPVPAAHEPAASASREAERTRPLTASDFVPRAPAPTPLPDNDTDLESEVRAVRAAEAEKRAVPHHSRVPFVATLSVIVAATVVTSTWVARTTYAKRVDQARVAAVASARKRDRAEKITPQRGELVVSRALKDEGRTAPTDAARAETQATKVEPPTTRTEPSNSPEETRRLKREPKAPAREEDKPQRDEARAPAKASTPQSGGSLKFTTSPAVKVARGDKSGGTVRLARGSSTGVVVIGEGADPVSDPFTVTLAYRVEGELVSYVIESEPWAIVSQDGTSLTRVPATAKSGPGSTTFELKHPKEGRVLKVTVRFSP